MKGQDIAESYLQFNDTYKLTDCKILFYKNRQRLQTYNSQKE